MRIAILQTGHNNPNLPNHLRDYPQMFVDLLAPLADDSTVSFTNYAAVDGHFPSDCEAYDGYIITGSRHGVYEDHAFIPVLTKFIQQCYAKKIPQVGICFGHQAIAQALGGEVIKSDKGWGVGIRKVDVVTTTNWMEKGSDSLDLIYVHQDQVVALPDDAIHLAGDEFCPNAAFAIDDHVFTLQGHPEFDKGYVHELLAIRGDDMGKDVAEKAANSLADDHEGVRAGKWIMSFFNKAIAARTDARTATSHA